MTSVRKSCKALGIWNRRLRTLFKSHIRKLGCIRCSHEQYSPRDRQAARAPHVPPALRHSRGCAALPTAGDGSAASRYSRLRRAVGGEGAAGGRLAVPLAAGGGSRPGPPFWADEVSPELPPGWTIPVPSTAPHNACAPDPSAVLIINATCVTIIGICSASCTSPLF